jgi:hypothetical protein
MPPLLGREPRISKFPDFCSLIESRKREEQDPCFRKLRHEYLDHVSGYVEKLKTAETKPDAEEVLRCFTQDASDD